MVIMVGFDHAKWQRAIFYFYLLEHNQGQRTDDAFLKQVGSYVCCHKEKKKVLSGQLQQ